MSDETGRSRGGMPLGDATILTLAGTFGLLTGVMEALARFLQRYVLGVRMWVSPDVVWMAPLMDLAIFLVLGIILVAAARAWPALRSAHAVVGIFVLVALLGPLLSYPRLHVLAGLALAAGIAVQAGRMAPSAERLRSLAVRVGWALVAVTLLSAGVLRGSRWLEERRMLHALPPAETDAPNVLLIILDTVRAASLSAYGYAQPTTPTLEAVADRGVLFEHAWSTSSWTLPAHASLFTGRYPHELSTGWLTPLDETHPTLAERFSAHGYSTAGFVANLMYTTRDWGLQRGFAHYEDYPVSAAMAVQNSWLARLIVTRVRSFLSTDQKLVRKHAEEINRDFLDWLGDEGDRPFFVFLNYMDAHAPYLPPEPFAGRFGPRRERRAMKDLSRRQDWSEAEVEAELAEYEGAIAWLDSHLGLLFDALEERGELANTIVVVTSDHGEQFGEHGLMDHGNSLYVPALEVPLIIAWPAGMPAGVRIAAPVSLRDVGVTLTDLALGEPELPGQSLARLWLGDAAPTSPLLAELQKGIRVSEWLPVARGDLQSLVSDGYHFIRNSDGQEELFDLRADHDELVDLAATEASRPRLDSARTALEALLP